MEGDKADDKHKLDKESIKKRTGIPEAEFIEDVEAFLGRAEYGGNVDIALKKLDDLHGKYKFMESNLLAKRRRLMAQIPDLVRSEEMVKKLETQEEDLETEFLLSEQVYAKARIPPTKSVCLWLGANVMLEYSLEEAKKLLNNNINAAKQNIQTIRADLDYVRDQATTTEVNMARVFNWDVKRRTAKLP